MRSIPTLGITLLFVCSVFPAVQAQTPTAESSASSPENATTPVADANPQAVDAVTRPLAPGTRPIRTLVVDGVIVAEERDDRGASMVDAAIAAGANAGGEERLIYSNTLGRVAADFGANRLISDDITTTALSGCGLTRFSFDVDGRVQDSLPGGPYTVSWALYNTCPYAVTGPQRAFRIAPGTAGGATFQDDVPRTVEVVLPVPVSIPNHLWLGLTFSRANAGAIMGAPAMVGFTEDVIDFPGTACSATLGVFPANPHASFNVQMWGAGCPEVNLKYQNSRDSSGAVNVGANQWMTDDITLLAEPCMMRGYSVGVRGPGTYNFELRESCDGPVIPGTEKMQVVGQASGPEPRVFEYVFDPPIPVPQTLAYAVKVNNLSGGPISYSPASIPVGGECFESYAPECTVNSPQALHFAVLCDGPAPVGACCDMYITQCVGDPNDREPCGAWYAVADCSPGTCESVCRDVPQLNCLFPPRFTQLGPKWDEGETCASDADPDGAFPGHICGLAACCTSDDTCLNLTKNECDDYQPVDEPHHWQMGKFCGEGEQYCPHAGCLYPQAEGACYLTDHTPGCSDFDCCELVCSADPWCCRVEWDRGCLEWADALCSNNVIPANDTCGPTPANTRAGATPINPNSSVTFTNRWADRDRENRTTCTLTSEFRCLDQWGPGPACDPDTGCTFGSCELYDWPAFNTVWFKFTASHSSAQVGTCNSPNDLSASIHVFAVDGLVMGQHPCDHLSLVGCTAADGCGTSEQACLCVDGLTVGEEYYIMVGSRWDTGGGVYQLDITSPCDGARCCPREDCNNNCVNDRAETTVGDSPDCDGNRVPDVCDLLTETTNDCDSDGLLDGCEWIECCLFGCWDGSDGRSFDANIDCRIDLLDFQAFQNCFDPQRTGDLGCCIRMQSMFGSLDDVIDLLDWQLMRSHLE